MKNVPLVEITQKLIGQEYELGKIDCFSLILNYLDLIEYKIPDEFYGLTRETYKDLYLSDPNKAKEIMISFMLSFFKELPLVSIFPKDIVLLRYGKNMFLGIVSGNGGVIIASTNLGIHLNKLSNYKIEKVFRCQEM